MNFGVNENVNYVKPVETTGNVKQGVTETNTPPVTVGKTPNKTQGSSESEPPPKMFPKTNNEITFILGSAVTLGFLVARYVI